jgi:hypothetical protein
VRKLKGGAKRRQFLRDFLGRLAQQEHGACLAVADIGISPYCGGEYSAQIISYKAAGLPDHRIG